MTTIETHAVRLPLWRAIAGFGVLGGLVAVLLLLAPAYVRNYRFTARMKAVVAANGGAVPNPLQDDPLRNVIVAEARSMDLVIFPGDVKITNTAGRRNVELKYIVQLYRMDLHFHPSVSTK